MSVIQCQQVSLSYDGLSDAVSGLTFAVEAGTIFALVGPNGAGKTSTLRMLATLTRPTSGQIRIAGHDVDLDREEVCRCIGFLPDHFALYEQMTPLQLLGFFARCHEVPDDVAARRIEQLIEELDLNAVRESPIRALSRGTRQRVGLAKTLVHDPRVLILDEPASALDPDARTRLQETLLRLRRERQLAILISSHILPELAGLADHVGIMDRGRAVHIGPLDRAARLPDEATYVLEVGRPHKVRPALASLGQRLVRSEELSTCRYEVTVRGGDETVADLVEALVLRGARVSQVAPRQSRLEVIYQASMTRREQAEEDDP
jgi:ABC-2 type transport system ATP-binding protein